MKKERNPARKAFDTSSQEQPQTSPGVPSQALDRLPHERDESAFATGDQLKQPVQPSERRIKDAAKNVKEGQRDTDRRGIPNDVPGK